MASLVESMKRWGTEHGSKIAVIYDNGNQKRFMVYNHLDQLSNMVSDYLRKNRLGNEIVGIINGDPLLHPALILGVLKADAAFWSIEKTGPAGLLRYLVAKLAIRVLLCSEEQPRLLDILTEFQATIYDIPNSPLKAIHFRDVSSVKSSISLAYVITTSGTTGRPKVVKVPNLCITPNIAYFKEMFQMTEHDVVFQASPWTFDPSLVNLFTALSSGASLLIVSESLKLLPHKLTDLLMGNRVSIIQATPALILNIPLALLQDKLLSAVSSLRVLALGGEQCPRTSTLRTWRGKNCPAKFFNVYGITEVSCWATCHEVSQAELEQDTAVPLGECLSDTKLVIKDSHGKDSDAGLLYISGENRVCTIDDEIDAAPGTWRCTGDHVRRHGNGMLYYEGRTDEQCKHNGRRLNLLHLQEVALENRDIASAVALVDCKQFLVLFVTLNRKPDVAWNTAESSASPMSSDNSALLTEGVISQLQQDINRSLPSQYFPDDVLVLNNLPMTSHGKVDKKTLMQKIHERDAPGSSSRPPTL